MNSSRQKWLTAVLSALTIFSIMFNMALPISDWTSRALAQEITEEPTQPTEPVATEAPTETATEETAQPTEPAPTEAPVNEATVEPVMPTEPAAPPLLTAFEDQFQDGNTDGWMLTPGWQISAEGDNAFLSALGPNESATIPNIALLDLALTARIRIEYGDQASIAFNAGTDSYILTLDALGNTNLLRSGVVVAQGPQTPPPNEPAPALWHTVLIESAAGTINVSLNGALYLTFTDPAPLPAGLIVFSTGPANVGTVSIDQVIISAPQPPATPMTVPTEITATAVPSETPAPVTDAPLETTPEVATTEAATPAGTVLLAATFEGELTGWAAGEGTSIVTESEANRALLMTAGSALLPAETLYLADFQLDARVNIVSDGSASGISILFRTQESRGYALSFEAGQTALYRSHGEGPVLLANAPVAHAANTWHTLSVKAQGGQFIVTVNGVVELDYTDTEPLSNGQIGFIVNPASSVMVDDIVVTDFTSADALATASPTPTPLNLTDEEKAKLPAGLADILALYLSGDEAGALEMARLSVVPFDEKGRVYVIVGASVGATSASVAQAIEMVGGVVDFTHETVVEARIPLSGFVALVNVPQIGGVAYASLAISTGSTFAPAQGELRAPAGTAITEGYDILSVNDWHLAGFTGVGSKIAVIDSGFNGITALAANERPCLASTTPVGGLGIGDHGVAVVQAICDIAPAASVVTMYTAATPSQIASQIAAATLGNQIILITLDMGAHVSPGDGTGNLSGWPGVSSVYANIAAARSQGKLVIVSAGNSNGRYASFTHPGGGATVSVNILATAGDVISVSWDGWSDASTFTVTLQDTGDNDSVATTPVTVRSGATGSVPGGFVNVPATGPGTQGAAGCWATDTPSVVRNFCDIQLTITGATSKYVQVQVQPQKGVPESLTSERTAITSVTGVGSFNTNGIGRPADSSSALTVGAVCARQHLDYPIRRSSRGPIFNAGGSGIASSNPSSRTGFKPDIVGPADVTVAGNRSAPFTCDDDDTTGFGGTSAAAAHVAGMAALLLDNNNLAIPFNTTTAQRLTDYMQSHAIDLYAPASAANGFDMAYGAGLAVLGNPAPTYPLSVDPSLLTDVPACPAGGNNLYVGTFNLNVNLGSLGTRTNPYLHIAHALANAPANGCVVLLPGEYITSIAVTNTTVPANGVTLRSYDIALDALLTPNDPLVPQTLDSVVWVNNGQEGNAGINITGKNLSVDGMVFIGANPLNPSPATQFIGYQFDLPRAIVITSSTGNIISSNTFRDFDSTAIQDLGGQLVTVGVSQSPLRVENSQGVSIRQNIFQNNDIINNLGGGTLFIKDSGGSTPILVQLNSFIGNKSTGAETNINTVQDPVLFINNSVVNVYSNRFVGNSTQAIIRILNPGDTVTTRLVTVFSNSFQDNTNKGPIVHLDPARRFRFINNSVTNNGAITGQYGAIIVRDNLAGSNPADDGLWDIHNNLLYNNGIGGLLTQGIITDLARDSVCGSLSGGQNNGARNNWAWDSGTITGDCFVSLSGFNNKIQTVDPLPNDNFADPNSQFVGPSIDPDNPYRLRFKASDGLSTGIQGGDNALVIPASLLDPLNAESRDAVGNPRIERPTGSGGIIDIGAFEFKEVKAVNFTAPAINEDTPSTTFPLQVDGGFPPFTWEIVSYPTNFDNNPANACGGQRLTLSGRNVTFCPPANFYTVGAPSGSTVSFTYQVRDVSGKVSENVGTVTIPINPTPDTPLTTPYPTYTVLTAAVPSDAPFSFRLRPSARFNNFRLIAPGTSPNIQADYPYDYSGASISGGNANLFVGGAAAIIAAINNADGTGLVNLTQAGGIGEGFVEITYNATDVNSSTATGNRVRIEIVTSLPYQGLHDDTSFAFDYVGAGWSPSYSEPNINNTLHISRLLNDQADFTFVGTDFSLYMQAITTGGAWELQIIQDPVVTTLSWLNGVASNGSITCRTSAPNGLAGAGNANFISNLGTQPYTVSCTGLQDGEGHTVRIINRSGRILNVDAIGILNDNEVLLPGFHDVDESQMVPLFNGWTRLNFALASNGVAMTTTNRNIPDLLFSFKGTGFAIGTTLEYNTLLQGAKYEICVNQVCQAFDNGLGSTRTPTWRVFRPFYGFDPTVVHDVRINVTDIPAGARMVIDSIVIFDIAPTGTVPIGGADDETPGPIVFGNGLPDTWQMDTLTGATSLLRGVPGAGPFISFRVPGNADSFVWYRLVNRLDSTSALICVDRAQGEAPGQQSKYCVTRNLPTAGNPIIIRESEFDSGSGWGTPFGAGSTHTVEIFSLTNQQLSLDRIQVLDSTAPLVSSTTPYEQVVPNLRYFDDDAPTYTFDGTTVVSSFTTLASAPASGGSVARTVEANEGVFFRFTGTGFAPMFTLDRFAGPVRICWLKSTNATVNDVLTNGSCQIINNYSLAVNYRVMRPFLGLENTTYSVVIQHAGVDYNATLLTGNTMQIDGVRIFNDNWTTLAALNQLNTRYETSFLNRVAANRFQYYGTGWLSVSGTRARSYSGSDYDQVRAFGAGVVFRTAGGDTVRLYRDTRLAYAPLLACAAPHNGSFVVDYSNLRCWFIRNDGGTGFQQPFNLRLSSATPHVVMITTLTAGIFTLDAVEVVNSTPALTPGLYPDSDPRLLFNAPVNDVNTYWRTIPSALYTNGGALQSSASGATLTFSFTGTGFSLLTQFDSFSGALLADIEGTGTNDFLDVPLNSYSAATVFNTIHSVAGLPNDTYLVTITENEPTRDRFTVDGVQIYGATTPMEPGLYDDAATDSAGASFINYGPDNAAWIVSAGTAATTYLNRTNRYTVRTGAQASFDVTGANAITLYHSGSTSSQVRVCATLKTAPFTRVCETRTLVGATNSSFTTPFGSGVGNYLVSITNLTTTFLYLDAIGVHNTTGNLTEGIYQENHPQLAAAFTNGAGTWGTAPIVEAAATDRTVRSTVANTLGQAGQQLTFTFTGTGFSVVLVESTLTSGSYTLCVNPGTSAGCGTINAPLAPVNATPGRRPVALTYVGFSSGTYTVRITNNDSTRPLLIDRVDILGTLSASEQIDNSAGDITGNIENTDPRIFYFPFNSLTPTSAGGGLPAGAQHIGTMQGSVIYFELNDFEGTGFEYIRTTASSYGSAFVCSGAPGTNSSGCAGTLVPNNAAPFGARTATAVPVDGAGIRDRWVIIRSQNNLVFPLDSIRPIVASVPLTKGYYEETHPNLQYLAKNGSAANPPFATIANRLASGGSVAATTTAGDAVLFQFTGTGFSIYTTLDLKAEQVKLCWLAGTQTLAATLAASSCQVYDNQSAVARYQAARTVVGLSRGTYTVAMQLLDADDNGAADDNGVPFPHTHPTLHLPITMQVDAVAIHDDTLPANVLSEVGTRYETSFANRQTDNRFLYYGTGWLSATNAAYFGSNYDTINSVVGAGVVFRVSNASTAILYRNAGAGYAPLQACVAPSSNPSSKTCTILSPTDGMGVKQPVNIPVPSTAEHIVSIITTDGGLVILDAIEIANTSAPLQPGVYEDTHPGLTYNTPGAAWTNVFSTAYTAARAKQTNVIDATLEFRFSNAVGFEVGTAVDRFGGEVEVCYRAGDNNWADTGNNRCYVYQNEALRLNTTISRTVTGLLTGNTYFVRVRNVEDGFSVLTVPPGGARLAAYTPAQMRIDYVSIYGTTPPSGAPAPAAVVIPGTYNEDATSGGTRYIQLLPADRWTTFTNASGFSNLTYTAVTELNRRGAPTLSSRYAGPTATMLVQVPANSEATVIVYTGTASSLSSDLLLVCANHVTTTNCTTITNLRLNNQLVLNKTNLPALNNASGSPVNVTLSIRAVNPGLFRIDGFQVIYGTTLTAGVYDDFLFTTGTGNLVNMSGTTEWLTLKNGTALGSSLVRTATLNANLNFTFSGTGFSVLTQADTLGVDFRVCYAVNATFDGSFDDANTTGETCQILTTNTTVADWTARNGARLRPAAAFRFGFSFYGLANTTYRVEIKHVDTTTIVGRSFLQVDAIAVFGSAGAALTPGQVYDNTQAGIVYAPGTAWTDRTFAFGPWRGPWRQTESSATNAGAIVQMNVAGNAVVVYQTVSLRSNSRYIRVCISTSTGPNCSEFSQTGAVRGITYFTPIAFYGFGIGTHEIVLENYDHGRSFNIDAVQVLP